MIRIRYSAMGKVKHRIWELRHDACKKCHGETSEDPCICGVEPCKNCGEENRDVDLNELGCDLCTEPDYPRSVVVSDYYYIEITCPYCKLVQYVEGHSHGFHPRADILQCHSCNKRAWLGRDTRHNADFKDIDSEKANCRTARGALLNEGSDV